MDSVVSALQDVIAIRSEDSLKKPKLAED